MTEWTGEPSAPPQRSPGNEGAQTGELVYPGSVHQLFIQYQTVVPENIQIITLYRPSKVYVWI